LVAIDFVPEEPLESEVAVVDDNTEESEVNTDGTADTTSRENTPSDEDSSTAVTQDETSQYTTGGPTGALPVTGLYEQPAISNDRGAEMLELNNGERVYPSSLVINTLDRTVAVLNPESRRVADLDAALLEGVVRHPDSAALGEDGTVFLLGHSSYLPNVFNRNFQAFNGIQDLAWGDTIELLAEGVVYEYQVENVYRARAQDVTVPIAGDEPRLVLATCNSFGSVDDRFIVEAKQVAIR
jgi:LPXTG-site transpeptidase (sortase) family protein